MHTAAPDKISTLHVRTQRSSDSRYIKAQAYYHTSGICAPYWSNVGRLTVTFLTINAFIRIPGT